MKQPPKKPDNRLLEQLDADCRMMYAEASDDRPDRQTRILALVGMIVCELRRKTITSDECEWYRRSRIDWKTLALVLPGMAAMVTLILQLFGLI